MLVTLYAYRPDVVVLAKDGDLKIVVNDNVYNVRRY